MRPFEEIAIPYLVIVGLILAVILTLSLLVINRVYRD
jgi:hypothetical protein